jgi:aldehyde dehydrogenase (NAD+)
MKKEYDEILKKFNLNSDESGKIDFLDVESDDGKIRVESPIDKTFLVNIKKTDFKEYSEKIEILKRSENDWKKVPAPQRGELIRLFGEELRKSKLDLGKLVTIESGKILQEGLGEVQEMIDICDFSVGLSRQLYGLTMPSERAGHRIQEIWHPLGTVGIVTSFNFPVAVLSWNFAIATICGNVSLWKPSPKTPITALAVYEIWKNAVQRYGNKELAKNIFTIVNGDKEQAEWIAKDRRINLVSLTGSTEMGKNLGRMVTERFGKLIMELGGNNAMIVTPSANMKLATRAIIFSAVGTSGQRCTTLRRVIAHNSIYDDLTEQLKIHYKNIRLGNPLKDDVLIGPIINEEIFQKMTDVLNECKLKGGRVFGGERITIEGKGVYVTPAIVELDKPEVITKTETFAPILYLVPYEKLDDAIKIQNDVPQGLASCIFSNDLLETEQFIGQNGSDCGIVNVNIGPSGAEIGGAFGGEKETGGGRESGSDAWKSYMRRATITTNFSSKLPLSQGIDFDI